MTELFRLTYVSTAARSMSERQVRELANCAAAANERLGMTGLLLFNGTNFMQTLEGDRPAVLELFDRINADPRHTGVICIYSETVDRRAFDGWAMSYRGVRFAGRDRLQLVASNGFAWEPGERNIPAPLLSLYKSFNSLAR